MKTGMLYELVFFMRFALIEYTQIIYLCLHSTYINKLLSKDVVEELTISDGSFFLLVGLQKDTILLLMPLLHVKHRTLLLLSCHRLAYPKEAVLQQRTCGTKWYRYDIN